MPEHFGGTAGSANRSDSGWCPLMPRWQDEVQPMEESLMDRKQTRIRRFRDLAFSRQAGRCHYCDQPMWLSDQGPYAAKYELRLREASRFRCTTEHLLARKDGGRNTSSNIVAACHFFNRKRHARGQPLGPGGYMVFVQRRVLSGRWHGARFLARFREARA